MNISHLERTDKYIKVSKLKRELFNEKNHSHPALAGASLVFIINVLFYL
jgi:hypothetical protein